MIKSQLTTPATLIDLDIFENNIKKYQEACFKNNKEMWPMLKTHKSSEIMKIQIKTGATGVLCGTLDEAESAVEEGINNIMYAYPVASLENIKRIINISKKSNFIIRLDSYEVGFLINEIASKENLIIQYTIIIDSGLHRFGVSPEETLSLANKLKNLNNIKLVGISTHPGQVYGVNNMEGVKGCAKEEIEALKIGKNLLESNGFKLKYITTGSTPTFEFALKDKNINILHPGNYPFLDNIQVSLGVAEENNCALSVLATIVSKPNDKLFIIDAGAKCLGLDQGAHGNNSIVGYGKVKNHPEIVVLGLSEEVGKLSINGDTTLKIGDKIEIIPNHACSCSNLTDNLIGIRKNKIEKMFKVDIRSNKKTNI